jgi:DNA-binding MarR family transcriptional regulator
MSPVRAPRTTELAADLRVVVGRLSRRVRSHGSGGLSPSVVSALVHIDEQGPLRLTELAAREGVSAPTMSKVVDALVAQGLAVREPDPADARATRVTLTDSGRSTLEELRRSRTAALARALDGLTPDELDRLAQALPVLRSLVDALAVPAE